MTEPVEMVLTSLDIAEEKREESKRCLGGAFAEVFAGKTLSTLNSSSVCWGRVERLKSLIHELGHRWLHGLTASVRFYRPAVTSM